MDYIIAFLVGAFLTLAIVLVIAKRLMVEWKRDMEKLKDFDTWKKWKNETLP